MGPNSVYVHCQSAPYKGKMDDFQVYRMVMIIGPYGDALCMDMTCGPHLFLKIFMGEENDHK